MSLSKSFGRLFGEIVNAGEECAKGFVSGFKEGYDPESIKVDPKTKEEMKEQWARLLDNTERIVNKAADKLDARRQNN
jgi:hypothetical protein